MNAKTLENLVSFRSVRGIDVVKDLIFRKISYQFTIIKRKDRIDSFKEKISSLSEKNDIFIIEAQAAKEYWYYFSKLISNNSNWYGRNPHNNDPINQLLDIGYHYLVNEITKNFKEIDLPFELGLLHIAQSKKSKPLVYDFIEWLRPIIVDKVLLSYIRKKKIKLIKLNKKDIGIFINKIKNELEKPYYNKKLGYCISLRFWIRINLLNLLSAINSDELPEWDFPSLRHESRCKKIKPRQTSRCR